VRKKHDEGRKMKSENSLARIESYISKIPAFPTTVIKVIEICNDKSSSPSDMNKIISLDPVLTGKVLKLINSTYCGLPKEIVSLVRAIILLGINTVRNLALSTAVMSSLGSRKNFKILDMDEFWKHSLGVGVISKIIAKKRKITQKQQEEYFIAGFLHDIGKIPLYLVLTDKSTSAVEVSDREHKPLYLSEKDSIDIDHTQSGKLIAEKWKLGNEITDTVAHHHSPETYRGAQTDILYTVIMANYFANISEIGFSGDKYPEEVGSKILQHLNTDTGISLDYLDNIVDEVNLEIEKAQLFLQIA
jgi:HD-like signal output (HDOD) protein